jgi:hypothetical protein
MPASMGQQETCNPRANCLNLKEIGKLRNPVSGFDLRHVPIYLKVKITENTRRGWRLSMLPRGRQAGMIAS